MPPRYLALPLKTALPSPRYEYRAGMKRQKHSGPECVHVWSTFGTPWPLQSTPKLNPSTPIPPSSRRSQAVGYQNPTCRSSPHPIAMHALCPRPLQLQCKLATASPKVPFNRPPVSTLPQNCHTPHSPSHLSFAMLHFPMPVQEE